MNSLAQFISNCDVSTIYQYLTWRPECNLLGFLWRSSYEITAVDLWCPDMAEIAHYGYIMERRFCTQKWNIGYNKRWKYCLLLSIHHPGIIANAFQRTAVFFPPFFIIVFYLLWGGWGERKHMGFFTCTNFHENAASNPH